VDEEEREWRHDEHLASLTAWQKMSRWWWINWPVVLIIVVLLLVAGVLAVV
jgi:hypothetical protein